MTATAESGPACAPNLSAGARRLRVRAASVMAAVTVVVLVGTVALDAPWWVRALTTFALTLGAAISYFQARASVCIVAAAQGVYEDDGRRKTPMEATLLPAIRRAAGTIVGKAMLVALAAGSIATLTSLVR